MTGIDEARARRTRKGAYDAAQCAPYSIDLVTNALSAFPAIGTPVLAIPASDTAAQAAFKAITGIPNIAPKGTNGTLSNDTINNYPATDPDCWWTSNQCLTPKVAGLSPDTASVPEPRTLGYGFDDGPFCSHNEFYNYLSAQNQKASDHGTNVMWFPLQAQRAVADGHEICVHTWSHHAMTAFTNEAAFAELYYTIKAIKLVTGYTPKCWRPPQGDVDDRIRYIASKLNLETILWKYDSFDWKVAGGQATTADVTANYQALITAVGSGTFDSVRFLFLAPFVCCLTKCEMFMLYSRLARSYSRTTFNADSASQHIVPIAVAQNKTNPYMETNYTMPSFADYVSSRTSGAANSTKSSGAGSGSGSGSSPSGGASQGSSGAVSLQYAGSGLVAALTLLGAAFVVL
ncbi:carbohydrate esterase family 4 protein [Mycena filopes]|nr:carbohydrate esterase family 4 protein [Mycena filopes]KAJ7185392.1 carbohydrate esterase family 4 protein [Mycena filopes]